MTSISIDLKFQKMVVAEDVVMTLYSEASTAIDKHSLIDVFCNVFIPMKNRVVFCEVRINTLTSDVQYYVTSNQNKSKRLPVLSYNNAIRELRALMI